MKPICELWEKMRRVDALMRTISRAVRPRMISLVSSRVAIFFMKFQKGALDSFVFDLFLVYGFVERLPTHVRQAGGF